MKSFSARKVWTSTGWLYNARVCIQKGIIDHIDENIAADECDIPVLIPGMIELHVHGSMGYNAATPNQEENAIWLRRLAEHGVTGVTPTLGSAPVEEINQAVAFYDEAMRYPVKDGARVLGVHLEGPFLNVEKKGGIDERYIHSPSISHYQELVGEHGSVVKLITVAPELENTKELILYLTEQTVSVNAGHSNATAEQMRDAISWGLDGVTHFFNAARPISHRDPGFLTEALLNAGVFCEVVSDLAHLAPEIIRLLIQCAGPKRLVAITDAVTLTGMLDGNYSDRIVVNGSPRLENGTLAGGRYLMDRCAEALIKIGIDPWDVFCMTSHTPARRIGVTDLGDIAPSYVANLVGMDEEYRVLFTLIDGEKVHAQNCSHKDE